MRVYLDYNATAPVRPEVRAAVEPWLFDSPAEPAGNPSSVHWAGQRAKKRLEAARVELAQRLGVKANAVTFTSGGTESDSLALQGVLLHPKARQRRLLYSAVEHPAVRATAGALRDQHGCSVVELPVDARGQLELSALEEALRTPTTLVSVMAVNNETGICSPLAEIRRLCQAAGALLHVDAVQAAGRIPLPEADLLTLSGHKLGGLPGAGLLVAPVEVPLWPQQHGGPQERGRRAGTENLAPIVGLQVAFGLSLDRASEEGQRLGALRDRLDQALTELDGAQVIGLGAPRVPNTTTAVFGGVEGDSLLQALDLEGIAASSGSACSSGSLEPSHVLRAMGLDPRQSLAAVRFSLGWGTSEADVDRTIEVLPRALRQVRG